MQGGAETPAPLSCHGGPRWPVKKGRTSEHPGALPDAEELLDPRGPLPVAPPLPPKWALLRIYPQPLWPSPPPQELSLNPHLTLRADPGHCGGEDGSPAQWAGSGHPKEGGLPTAGRRNQPGMAHSLGPKTPSTQGEPRQWGGGARTFAQQISTSGVGLNLCSFPSPQLGKVTLTYASCSNLRD